MKLGILECDHLPPELKESFGTYPRMFQNLFESIDAPFEYTSYDVIADQYPANIDDCDAYLLTGSKSSVYDDENWILSCQDFVLQLHTEKKKMIGICFGHQLIAQALGGKVTNAEQGWALGVASFGVKQQKPWMEPKLQEFSILVSNHDQVIQLPEHAEHIASSDFCPIAAYQIEEHILSFQGHPEFTKEYSKANIERRVNLELIDKTTGENGLATLSQKVDSKIIDRWIVNFLL